MWPLISETRKFGTFNPLTYSISVLSIGAIANGKLVGIGFNSYFIICRLADHVAASQKQSFMRSSVGCCLLDAWCGDELVRRL